MNKKALAIFNNYSNITNDDVSTLINTLFENGVIDYSEKLELWCDLIVTYELKAMLEFDYLGNGMLSELDIVNILGRLGLKL
ncbi:hypothetical protein G7059_10330 [Erysipelothrix sp. HDW6A]|uniref:hypothetical protein n=1 Tax=Erysipelothrix sp. HDW6A TaxID=2714928 RepID=UPI0014099674|nr:hypothetical protein [Erysipelothrix sp. HDW6A]QIK58213.1 hypothetical protein G7059_10330 [Erysipelothrix sp. HDW6A]